MKSEIILDSQKTSYQYSSLTDLTLLIVVENFGLNFSGGSRATAMTTEFLKDVFKNVKILCRKVGIHNIPNTEIILYDNFDALPSLIDTLNDSKTIGFGDFIIAQSLADSNMPYFFTYHDNWPEMSNYIDDDPQEKIETYGKIFKNALHTFSVTEYKLPFIHQYTENVSVVRNGITQEISNTEQFSSEEGYMKILMAGNIDKRKYEKAIQIFDYLEENEINNIHIEIFGHVYDQDLKSSLEKYVFVEIREFTNEISHINYDLYLNTSLIENLSLSVVDALANHIPVVSFDVGGINEVINKENGILIPAFDTTSMAKAIVKIRDNKIQFNMKSSDLTDFNWKKSAYKMLNIMDNELVKNKIRQ